MAAASSKSEPLWQRWHDCPCGVSAQRDLYSADLSAYLDPADPLRASAQSRYAAGWEGREPGLRPRIRASHPTRECEAACASQCHASPETECVCLKVQAERHKGPPALKSDGKRGSKARNLRGFSPERSQEQRWCRFACL